jgi:hypothetical protein
MFQIAVPLGPGLFFGLAGIGENPARGGGAFQTRSASYKGEEGRPRRISDSIEEQEKGSAKIRRS